jgi:hypothetical protein
LNDANPVFESETTQIEGEQQAQIAPAIWYNPELDSNIQDTVIYEESQISIDDINLIVESEGSDIESEQAVVITKPFYYDPEADASIDASVVYEESYVSIDDGNSIVDSEGSGIKGEEPVVITKPFYYDPEADISTDDTIPEGESYVSIDYPVLYDGCYVSEIEDNNQGIQTKRIIQGSNNEGIDVPPIDISSTNEDINVPSNLFCILPIVEIECTTIESVYTGGNTFIFGAEDLAMNTAQSLLLATPITLEFTTGLDKLLLSQSTFSSIYTNFDGGISSFANVADDSLVDLNDAEIVYSQSTGKLFYNQNGAKIGLGDGGGQFATLSGSSALSAGDFGVLSDLSAC